MAQLAQPRLHRPASPLPHLSLRPNAPPARLSFFPDSAAPSSFFLTVSSPSLPFPEKRQQPAVSTLFSCPPSMMNLWRNRTVTNVSSSSSGRASDYTEERSFEGGGGGGEGGGGEGAGGSGGGSGRDDDNDGELEPQGDSGKNKSDALLALASLGKSLSDLPSDLAKAVVQGSIPGSIIHRYFELEKNPFFKWLLQYGGMKERLLADDLFMTKVAIEVGVGTITKTAAELERRRENFSRELDFVIADVMMAIIADFMLVFLPAPTVPLGSLVSKQTGLVGNLFRGCPDNAFQVALTGTSYTLLQRFGAIIRNGGKLFCVATSASIIGTSATNVLISVRKALNKDYAGSSEDVPILATSVAYGFYASVSSNLRYQFLAGVVEQRILQPWLHNQKLALSVLCFVIRTGNTFLGSLMWVDYARWVGVQKLKDDEVGTPELKEK